MAVVPNGKPRLLDLFCGAGGAAVGYARAGFEVVGVDIVPQPHYPFKFHQADAMTFPLDGFDAIHASPPCQAKTSLSNRWRGLGGIADHHPKLIGPTRARLEPLTVPWVIENVVGASSDMRTTVLLHGAMFGLGVHRPRLFESNVLMLAPKTARIAVSIGVYGEKPDGRRLTDRVDGSPYRCASSIDEGRAAMGGVDWMDWRELCESIPPAYTEWIGTHLLAAAVKAEAS